MPLVLLELKLIQTHTAKKQVLRIEVGALRVLDTRLGCEFLGSRGREDELYIMPIMRSATTWEARPQNCITPGAKNEHFNSLTLHFMLSFARQFTPRCPQGDQRKTDGRSPVPIDTGAEGI